MVWRRNLSIEKMKYLHKSLLLWLSTIYLTKFSTKVMHLLHTVYRRLGWNVWKQQTKNLTWREIEPSILQWGINACSIRSFRFAGGKNRATDQTLGGVTFHSSKLCRILGPHNLKFGGVGFEMETTFNLFIKEVNLLLEVCRKFRISPFYIWDC